MQEVDAQGESSGMGIKISKIDFKGIVVEWNVNSGIGAVEWNGNNGMK